MLATQQIFLIAALLCFLTFLTLLSALSAHVRGVRMLLLASSLGIVGNTLYAFGRELPPFLAYEAANVTYAAAGAALVAGYRQLAGMPLHLGRWVAAVAVLGKAVALFHYGIDSFAARSAVVSLFQAGVCGAIAHTVFASRNNWQRPFYVNYFVLCMCAIVAIGHAGRMVWLLFAEQAPSSLLQPSIWSVSFLIAASMALPALAIGGLLIAHRQIVTQAEHVANHDFLTGAFSRKAFFEIAQREMARAARRGQPLALLLVDLDNFKAINDGWGHEAGDLALRRVADGARVALRGVDCIARLGGDEFVLLLPDTGLQGAHEAGTKVQDIVRGVTAHDHAAPLTLSIGLTLVVAGEAIALAMARADEALYAAKAAGRDQIASRLPKVPLTSMRRRA